MISNKRPRIAIVLAQLRGAGIQRMRINIARQFLLHGHEVDFVIGKMEGELLDALPPDAHVFEVAKTGPMATFFGLAKYLRNRNPTHIMSSYEDISVMILLLKRFLGLNSFVLISTHNALSRVKIEGGLLRRSISVMTFFMMKKMYGRADCLVAVSQGVAEEMSSILEINSEAIHVIYNPVVCDVPSLIIGRPSPKNTVPTVAFFGRLHKQKRVDVLIKAFSIVRKSTNCRLLIAGEGVERPNLERLSRSLCAEDSVQFSGYIDHPQEVMPGVDVVVLSSDYEGLGNVLVEAMACGTQVISTDCPHGPSEILQGGRLGQLVSTGDIEGLAEAMRRTLTKRFWIPPDVLIQSAQRFSAGSAVSKYERLMGIGSS